MYLSTKDYELLKRIHKMLPYGADFIKLPADQQNDIVRFGLLLLDEHKSRRDYNNKQRGYMASKRAVDKDYGRHKKGE